MGFESKLKPENYFPSLSSSHQDPISHSCLKPISSHSPRFISISSVASDLLRAHALSCVQFDEIPGLQNVFNLRRGSNPPPTVLQRNIQSVGYRVNLCFAIMERDFLSLLPSFWYNWWHSWLHADNVKQNLFASTKIFVRFNQITSNILGCLI